MKTNHQQNLLAAALTLACALALSSSQAQNRPVFDASLTLADNDAVTASGGGTTNEAVTPGDEGTAKDEAAQKADLAKKLQNPVADLISVPIQNNWDFGIGPADAMRYTANIQPVVPVSISEDWNLIIRTILPVIYQGALDNTPGAPASVGESHSGLGDTTQSFFLSPKAPWHGWIWGAGPVGYYPTATDSALGAGKWGVGPTVVALRQEHGFTYGILANQIWSVAGWSDQYISATYLQPFLSYTTKTYTSFFVNSETTYNWRTDEATAPINVGAQQLLKIHKQIIALEVGYRYYIEKPSGGPDRGLRFQITFLFPK
jgi:hypothetical protein